MTHCCRSKSTESSRLTENNFEFMALTHGERQAGVAAIFDPGSEQYTYNAYCLETRLMTELFTCEYDFLTDALEVVNDEFNGWELTDLRSRKGCCESDIKNK